MEFVADAIPDRGIQLQWKTASEHLNAWMEIQRSQNGKSFETIGRIPGAMNSNEVIEYELLDANPIAGQNYFRIRQIDMDGRSTHSHVATAVWYAPEQQIFPNPSTGWVEVESSGEYELYDLSMRLVTKLSGREFDLSNLESGLYLMKFPNGGTQRLVLE
jgi:hypothetical protein